MVRPFLLTGAVCAVIPDLDAIGRWWYGAAGDLEVLGGHRGFTHSLTYAALCGVAVSAATAVDDRWRGVRLRFAVFIALATASHGALDTLTSIGARTSPVQFFSPFSTRGYTSPWQPIHGPFSELLFLLLPLILATRGICHLRGIPWPRRDEIRPATLGLK
jgi:inner membrane protein